MNNWNIIQFSSDGERYRLVDRALVDGYGVGDRFLEGCMFEVSVLNGELSVKASDDTEGYLLSNHCSVEAWESRVLESLDNSLGDCLVLDDDENGWESGELHLTADHTFYAEDQGLVLDETK